MFDISRSGVFVDGFQIVFSKFFLARALNHRRTKTTVLHFCLSVNASRNRHTKHLLVVFGIVGVEEYAEFVFHEYRKSNRKLLSGFKWAIR